MKKSDLTKKQKDELELFGANTWFVESLHKQYQLNPAQVPEQWRRLFKDAEGEKEIPLPPSVPSVDTPPLVNYPLPGENDETQPIAGSSARILENMTSSLSIPVATSQRSVPVKLLEENRIIINRQLLRRNIRVSFTHIIGWAILNAVKNYPVVNHA